MSKPEFSKEFNLGHAIAGAPIATVDRGQAKFVAYAKDANPACCVIVIADNGLIGTRRESGRVNERDAIDNPHDLVMTPLGMIDGKPVFVGDEFTNFHGAHVLARPMWRDFQGCKWPAPARIYPVTQMGEVELMNAAFSKAHVAMIINGDQACGIANAALRHAIDAKQVITADEHKAEIADLHSKWVTQITEMNGKRAARDMAVAEAVLAKAVFVCQEYRAVIEGKVANIALAPIIASVPS